MLESLFNKEIWSNFVLTDPNTGIFLWTLQKFSDHLFWRTCEWLLLSDVILTQCKANFHTNFQSNLASKLLFQNKNKKIISKIINLILFLQFSYICLFCHKIQWFYQDYKSENLCLILHSVHTVRILDLSLEIMLIPPIWGIKHLYNSKRFSFMPKNVCDMIRTYTKCC